MPKLSIQEFGSGRHSHNWMMGSFVRKRLNQFLGRVNPWFPVDFPWFRSRPWPGRSCPLCHPCQLDGWDAQCGVALRLWRGLCLADSGVGARYWWFGWWVGGQLTGDYLLWNYRPELSWNRAGDFTVFVFLFVFYLCILGWIGYRIVLGVGG